MSLAKIKKAIDDVTKLEKHLNKKLFETNRKSRAKEKKEKKRLHYEVLQENILRQRCWLKKLDDQL